MPIPKVSVIAAVYNASTYVQDRVPALLEQLEDVDGELIIVDDGSDDDSLDVAQRLTDDDPRVTIVALSRNEGVAEARQAGAKRAIGEYVWFVDLDDEWDAGILRSLLDIARDKSADVAVCGAAYVYSDGSVKSLHPSPPQAEMSGKSAVESLLSGSLKGHLWNKLFSRSIVSSLQFESSEVHSDLSMTATLLASADRVVFTPAILYRYLVRPGSIINSGRKRYNSLAIVERAVRKAAVDAGVSNLLVEDFSHRFFILSAIKDSYNVGYSAEDARRIRKEARARISPYVVVSQTMRSDRRRAVALLAAKLAPFTTNFIARKM